MAEPLKNIFSQELVESVAKQTLKEHPAFKSELFVQRVVTVEWECLELKQRMRQVSVSLGEFLPKNYLQSIKILKRVSNQFSGLEHMLFPDFVEIYGMEYLEESLEALEHFTLNSSSEFAIRPFILKFPEKTMKRIKDWSQSHNEHVRRLASEGCRPRLPWATALPGFKQDPKPVLNIIENLIEDESLYVRRSVANNFNDISKDNPEIVIRYAKKWVGRSSKATWVMKHACRGLLKKGEPEVLALFGFANTEHLKIRDFDLAERVKLGDRLHFNFTIMTHSKRLGKLRLEFLIDFVKANGKRSSKIFKISEGDYSENSRRVNKYFSFKPISTRKYYTGIHKLSIIINGKNFATGEFVLSD